MNGPSTPLKIISLAEEEFKGKEIRYHCEFVSYSKEPFDEIRRLLSMPKGELDCQENGAGLFVASLYLNSKAINTICDSNIANLVMDIGYLDVNRLMKNFPKEYHMLFE